MSSRITNYVLLTSNFASKLFSHHYDSIRPGCHKTIFLLLFSGMPYLNTRYWNSNNEIGDNSFNFFSNDISTGQIFLHGNVFNGNRKENVIPLGQYQNAKYIIGVNAMVCTG